jgi:formyltetrahydrofolate synthetase
MGFWEAIAIMIIAVVAINAFKEIRIKRGAIKESDLKALEQDIEQMKKDIAEIKDYIADLVIRLHDEG